MGKLKRRFFNNVLVCFCTRSDVPPRRLLRKRKSLWRPLQGLQTIPWLTCQPLRSTMRKLLVLALAVPLMAFAQPKPTLSTEVPLTDTSQKEIGEKMAQTIQSAGEELEKSHACESHTMAVVVLVNHNDKGEIVLDVEVYCKPGPDTHADMDAVPHA